MKALLLVFALMLATAASSQPVFTPSSPAVGTTPSRVLVPSSPVSPLVPLAGSTTANGAVAATGTNLPITVLPSVLASLQAQAEQALLALAAFNEGVPLPIVGNTSSPTAGSVAGITTQTPAGPATVPGTGPGALQALDRETLRALLVLQNDLERMVSLLRALNGTAPIPTGTVLQPGQ